MWTCLALIERIRSGVLFCENKGIAFLVPGIDVASRLVHMPAAGRAAKRILCPAKILVGMPGCFVGDTEVLIYPAALDCATIAGLQVSPEHASAHTNALWGSVCLVAGLGIATALVDEQRRRREAREQQEALDALFGGTDLLDDNDDDDANRLNLGLPFGMDAEGGDSDAPFVRHDALTSAAFQTGCDRVLSQQDGPWRGVVGNRLAGTPSARAVDIACPKATIRSVPSRDPVSPMHHIPATRKRTPSPAKPHRPRSGWLWTAVAGLLVLLGGGLLFHDSPFGSQPPTPAATCPAGDLTATSVTGNAGERHLSAQRIDTIQVGQRLVGRNPIREQAELVEPDPATWRKISLYMTKESGLGLWIDLLRPLAWIDEHGAIPGGGIYLEMPDMGAVGYAQVTYIGPCPPIEPGDGGAVVTGTFKHQADASNKVVHLQLEDQRELTGVTDNHPYWSVDREQFVPAGNLRPGELVDTIYGPKHVLSITPIAHNGFVYNVETTEHVYRVGSLGTLVHNSCASWSKGAYSLVGGHHVHAKAAFKNAARYSKRKAFSIGQDFMQSRGWSHQAMTAKQRQLFDQLARTGRPNTLKEHSRIAVESLHAGGATRAQARRLVAESLLNLRKQALRAPTNIPWN